ncbi:RodZ domain-containing protein [Pseudoalteromonas rubra]|uniref:Transcriptional regulator n=1 Tax=Pseudoalteromonas rubra TaxID=43658 RepID=A0A0F4QQR3_9GAMM|nr:RodZ family helix-turn-helix domain-containing protein [Pseudoalteromonas rubra]KJZ08947.1 transcriptional regulator [Pseudoalteromonas rubra]
MNEAEIDTDNSSDLLSLGQTLAKARHEQGVSFEEISARLKLSETQINKLEQDDYHKLGPETFVRGYIKSYCGLLGLDAQQTLKLYQSPVVPEQKGKMKSFSRRTEKEAHDNRLMWVSYAVLIVVIGSSAIWFWQNSSSQSEITPGDVLDIPQASVTTDNVQRPAPSTLNAERSVAASDTSVADISGPDNAPQSAPETAEPSVEALPSTVVQTPEAQPEALPELAQTPTTQRGNTSDVQVTPAAETVSDDTQSELAQSTIVMVFKEDSWVEIFDASQERVAFGVKKAGYTMTVSGQAPFSVVLGKHQAVSITLNGAAVDISSLPRNRLAKFNLPLAE